MNKCPYSHSHNQADVTDDQIINSENPSNISQAISRVFRQLKDGVDVIIDSPEKEQAVFAYRIFQFSTQLDGLRNYLNARISVMEEER